MGVRRQQLEGMLKTFYVDTSRGCALYTAITAEGAKAEAQQDIGRIETVNRVREATEEDIAWVNAMLAPIPTLERKPMGINETLQAMQTAHNMLGKPRGVAVMVRLKDGTELPVRAVKMKGGKQPAVVLCTEFDR
jgi:hypothetical protein